MNIINKGTQLDWGLRIYNYAWLWEIFHLLSIKYSGNYFRRLLTSEGTRGDTLVLNVYLSLTVLMLIKTRETSQQHLHIVQTHVADLIFLYFEIFP